MRFYISDLHFFHESLNVQMDRRGFASAEEMNEYMISRWNSRIRSVDDVVILGDFSVGRGPGTGEVLRRLKGTKYLISGNHDRFLEEKGFDRSLFGWIEPYRELHDHKRKVILSHYPIMCYNGQYRRDDQGQPKTYMLYGHVHDTFDETLVDAFQKRTRNCLRETRGSGEMLPIPCQMINCFCMFSDYVPMTLDEWIEIDRKRRDARKEIL